MSPIRVNFTDVETKNFDPIPAGKYRVFVTDGEIRESGPNSNNPGSEYINWEFTVDGGEYDSRKLWGMTSLLPHALFSLKGLLSAVGIDTDGELDFEIDDVIGKACIVKVTKRPANEEKGWDERNEIRNYYAADSNEGAAVGSNGASSSLLP